MHEMLKKLLDAAVANEAASTDVALTAEDRTLLDVQMTEHAEHLELLLSCLARAAVFTAVKEKLPTQIHETQRKAS